MIKTVEDLEAAIAEYRSQNYRLDMIFAADSPREAMMSVPLEYVEGSNSAGLDSRQIRLILRDRNINNVISDGVSKWHAGRAGMEYRDLLPERLGGKVIASHIRIVDGGPVADAVHFHKIAFQVIFCVKGAIKVVYEDQGPPFWLGPGDCVLQPPEIRHRVLEAEDGSEVVEITSPAEHETWFDHDLQLPSNCVSKDRTFGGQRFIRYMAGSSNGHTDHSRQTISYDTGIKSATGGMADVRVINLFRSAELINARYETETGDHLRNNPAVTAADGRQVLGLNQNDTAFLFVLGGEIAVLYHKMTEQMVSEGQSTVVLAATEFAIISKVDSKLLCVSFAKI